MTRLDDDLQYFTFLFQYLFKYFAEIVTLEISHHKLIVTQETTDRNTSTYLY